MNVTDLMTTDLAICSRNTPLPDAARTMRDQAIGDVLVRDDDGRLCGIVTDRDLVVRALADGGDPSSKTLGEVCSGSVHTVKTDAEIGDVIALMERESLRRVPVVDGDRPVGIVSLGDLAERLDGNSALGKISAAPPDA